MLPNLFLLLASLILSVALVEMFVRIHYDGKFGPRPAVYAPDDTTGWRPSSDLDYVFHGKDFETWIKTDADGYRLGALGTVPAGSKVVLAVGDSYTFGWGVATDQTYASYLDELVAAENGYRLVNLGVGGYSTLQSALRLQAFAGGAARPDIQGIVVLHSHNDMTDNVNFLRFLSGAISYEDFSENDSAVHSVNFMIQALDWINTSLSADSASFDMGFRRVDQKRGFKSETSAGSVAVRLGDRAIVSPGDITLEDLSKQNTLKRKRLTELQTTLLMAGLDQINCAAEDQGLPVVHALVHSAPEWYEETMAELVAGSEKCGNDIRFVGRVADPAACTECGYNQHSAGHFNAALNRYYAKILNEYLHRVGVFADADGSE